MKYFPAFCEACGRSFLAEVPAAAQTSAHPSCPRCSASGRLTPGAYYSAPAQLVFEQLERLLSRAHLSTPQAQVLSGLLENALHDGELSRAVVLQLLARFPGLTPLDHLLPEDGDELARAVRMLLTMLAPLATSPERGSGLRAAATPAIAASNELAKTPAKSG